MSDYFSVLYPVDTGTVAACKYTAIRAFHQTQQLCIVQSVFRSNRSRNFSIFDIGDSGVSGCHDRSIIQFNQRTKPLPVRIHGFIIHHKAAIVRYLIDTFSGRRDPEGILTVNHQVSDTYTL